ncbi:MAG: TerB family tellurite resistance protein [Acidobacteriota bacterium]|jgi:uncharacterized tellurite resistance protein B-like protein
MSLLSLLKNNAQKNRGKSETTDSVRKIVQELDGLDPAKAKLIACFAYLLNRTAGADLTVSPEETSLMEKIVMEKSGLAEAQAVVVVHMAKTQNNLFGGTENYLVAREFRELSSQRERLALLDCLYAVAASHDSISTVEDNEISQIADELRIEHRDFIAVRSEYRDHLSVLKQNE